MQGSPANLSSFAVAAVTPRSGAKADTISVPSGGVFREQDAARSWWLVQLTRSRPSDHSFRSSDLKEVHPIASEGVPNGQERVSRAVQLGVEPSAGEGA